MNKLLSILTAVIFALMLTTIPAHATLIGPTNYLSFSDSPFSGGSFSLFYLEDFEDGLLNTPGLNVTANLGQVTSTGPWLDSSVDSVDGDDGDPTSGDCPGPGCDSYWANGQVGVTLSFDESTLGGLPTHAGVVWTDGGGTITFKAYDENNNLLGTLFGTHADDNYSSGTAEDRFYGATNTSGISSIWIANIRDGDFERTGMEIDHIQYGIAGQSVVPEPASMLLFAGGLIGGAFVRRRKRS